MARRTWTALRVEHLARAGRTGDSNYTARAEALLEASYFDLCHLYFQHALFTEHTAIVLTQGQAWVTLPAGVDIVIGFEIRDASTSSFLRQLKGPLEANAVFTQRLELAQAMPERFARGNTKLYFDRLSDAAYKSVLFYYALPTAPVFDGVATPQIAQVWDERILEWSVARAQNALWVPELSVGNQQLVGEFIQQMPEVSLSQRPIPERKTAIGGGVG